jgi:hypothetical protein
VGVADVDQDGDLDLYARAFNDAQVSWWDNFDGAAGAWLERVVADGVTGASAVEVADLDHDGDPDFAATSYSGDSISWWKNDTIHRRFQAPDPLVVRQGLADPRAITIADLNGDDWLDITYALWDGDAVQACLAVLPDSNAWWSETIAASGFDGARAVTTADFNGDGALDVIAAAVNGDDVSWWQNDGDWDPSWTTRNLLGALDGAHRTAPADFDLDGDVDVAVAGLNADRIGLALNADGLGLDWDYYPDVFVVDGPFDMRTGDIDRSGTPDLAVSGYYSDSIRVMLNRHPAAWMNVSVAAGATTPRGIDLCDVDDDGDVDLVAVLRDVDEIHWYENDTGDGLTWVEHDVGSGAFVDGAGIRCTDFDADADADVVAAGQDGDSVYLWLNGGTGSAWTRYMMETSVDSPWEVDSGDLDRDGDVDLAVVAGGTTDSVLWYRNVGGQFGAIAYDEAPTHLLDGERDAILSFIVSHHGRIGDSDIELFALFVDLFDTGGTALTSAQANALIERIEIFRDDDDGAFEPAVDTLVTTVLTLSLTGGRQNVIFPDGLAAARMLPNESQRFFVAITAAPGAGGQSPNRIVASFPAAELIADDRTYDLALEGEPAATAWTDPITFCDLIFDDDFESGDCYRWDYWTGY